MIPAEASTTTTRSVLKAKLEVSLEVGSVSVSFNGSPLSFPWGYKPHRMNLFSSLAYISNLFNQTNLTTESPLFDGDVLSLKVRHVPNLRACAVHKATQYLVDEINREYPGAVNILTHTHLGRPLYPMLLEALGEMSGSAIRDLLSTLSHRTDTFAYMLNAILPRLEGVSVNHIADTISDGDWGYGFKTKRVPRNWLSKILTWGAHLSTLNQNYQEKEYPSFIVKDWGSVQLK